MTDSHFHDDHTRSSRTARSATRDRPTARSECHQQPHGARLELALQHRRRLGEVGRQLRRREGRRRGGDDAHAHARDAERRHDDPYAFGVSHGDYRGQPTVSHSGGWASFGTYVLHFPQQRFGVVVLSNGGGVNPTPRRVQHRRHLPRRQARPEPRRRRTRSRRAPAVDVAPARARPLRGPLSARPGMVRPRPPRRARAQDAGDPRGRSTDGRAVGHVVLGGGVLRAHDVPGRRRPPGPAALPRAPLPEARGVRRHRRAAQLRGVRGRVRERRARRRAIAWSRDSGLVMRHFGDTATIRLTHLWKDDFGGSVWFMRSVEFQRDASGRVTGFSVFIDERSRNVRFTKKS